MNRPGDIGKRRRSNQRINFGKAVPHTNVLRFSCLQVSAHCPELHAGSFKRFLIKRFEFLRNLPVAKVVVNDVASTNQRSEAEETRILTKTSVDAVIASFLTGHKRNAVDGTGRNADDTGKGQVQVVQDVQDARRIDGPPPPSTTSPSLLLSVSCMAVNVGCQRLPSLMRFMQENNRPFVLFLR